MFENILIIIGMIVTYVILSFIDKLINVIKKFVILLIVFLIFLPEPTKEFLHWVLDFAV